MGDSLKSTTPCPGCGAVDFHTQYMGDEGTRMKQTGECFNCAFWELRLVKQPSTVIDWNVYSPGNRTDGPYRGMGGRRFDIEYIAGPNSGKKITTFDLWSGGLIPERYRHRVICTAQFLGGAERANASGITCWDPSDAKAPTFPLPHQADIR